MGWAEVARQCGWDCAAHGLSISLGAVRLPDHPKYHQTQSATRQIITGHGSADASFAATDGHLRIRQRRFPLVHGRDVAPVERPSIGLICT
jgi:hypothetical protein